MKKLTVTKEGIIDEIGEEMLNTITQQLPILLQDMSRGTRQVLLMELIDNATPTHTEHLDFLNNALGTQILDVAKDPKELLKRTLENLMYIVNYGIEKKNNES